MKVLKAQWKPCKGNIKRLCGSKVYSGDLQILVDKIPQIKFEEQGNYYFGEKDGYFQVYKHKPGTTDGFGGREIQLKMKDGSIQKFKGSLWDPYNCPDFVPKHHSVSITTNPDVMKIGFTFYSGYVTEELWNKLIQDLEVDVEVSNF